MGLRRGVGAGVDVVIRNDETCLDQRLRNKYDIVLYHTHTHLRLS
jgi:hypothetical protein